MEKGCIHSISIYYKILSQLTSFFILLITSWLPIVTCLQVGPVMAYHEHVTEHHRPQCRPAWKPDASLGNCHLHASSCWYANLRGILHTKEFRW